MVDRRLDGALAVAKKFMTPLRGFTVRSAVEVLQGGAQSEYETSIEDGRFVKPVEYQDSRGFVLGGRAHDRGRRAASWPRSTTTALARIRSDAGQAQGGVARAHAAGRACPGTRRDVGADLRHRAARLEVLMSRAGAGTATTLALSPSPRGEAAGRGRVRSVHGLRTHRRGVCWVLRHSVVGALVAADAARAQQTGRPARGAEGEVRAPDLRARSPPTIRRSPAKIALGKRLFEDKELSSTGTIACASCHDPKLSFTRRRAHRQGRHRQAPGAAHAYAVERGLEPAAVLGRPRRQPGRPGAVSRRASRRDGRHARQRRAPLSRGTKAT